MFSKDASPVVGYNSNVRHHGKLFHIQTEDSGVKYSHIVTQLFADGGRVLKSVKTSYAEYRGSEKMADIVREMMKQQHKAMFIALRDGLFDASIEPAAPPSTASPSSRPPKKSKAPPDVSMSPANQAPLSIPVEPVTEKTKGGTLPEPLLDIDALERAASAVAPVFQAAGELPPPPPVLFRDRDLPGGKAPVPRRAPSRPAASTAPGSERRYAPTRPAAIFSHRRASSRPAPPQNSVADATLDELILTYLRDEPEAKKKTKG